MLQVAQRPHLHQGRGSLDCFQARGMPPRAVELGTPHQEKERVRRRVEAPGHVSEHVHGEEDRKGHAGTHTWRSTMVLEPHHNHRVWGRGVCGHNAPETSPAAGCGGALALSAVEPVGSDVPHMEHEPVPAGFKNVHATHSTSALALIVRESKTSGGGASKLLARRRERAPSNSSGGHYWGTQVKL